MEQLLILGSRMNESSIRFKEDEYDVLETKKKIFISSPHG